MEREERPDTQLASAHLAEQVGRLGEAGAGRTLRIAGKAGGEVEPARRTAIADPIQTDPALVNSHFDLVLAPDQTHTVGELNGVLCADARS